MNKQILRKIVFVGLFLVPFVPFLFSSSLFFPFITTKAFAWRIIVEVVFAAWLVLALLDANYRPKRSLILYSILAFLVAIGLADLLGLAPIKSFWSNFERMEGYVTLLHLGALFLVISSVFKEVDWKRWWNTSLAASFVMVLYSVLQLNGLFPINQGGVRVDGTFGNAIYLAVYLLFHIFVALFYLLREWKNSALRWTYGILIFLQASILYFTATRGAIIGLVGGILVTALINITNKENKPVRRASIAAIAAIALVFGAFFVLKDADFMKESPVLSRFSSLTLEELKTQGRYFVWPMAVEGFKERPIFGWGQENFSYVFQKHYSPEMFRLEPWFDRAHNIFLDWAVSGGLVGLLAYLSLYVALLILIWRRQDNQGNQGGFSRTEKSVLTGLVAAYFFHNFFVFDNLISYVLFFSLLGYVHSRTTGNPLWQANPSESLAKFVLIPGLALALALGLYFVNVRPIATNVTLIESLKAVQTPGQTLLAIENLKKAYDGSRLGRPEVVEQIAQNAVGILSQDISTEAKNEFFNFAGQVIMAQTEDLKGDARYQLIAGSFLSSAGLFNEALLMLEEAKKSIPGKQQVYFEIGAVYINRGEPEKALEAFKEAYDLAPGYPEAKLIY
ncbi:MAG: O-antigen ligase family protein, partial [Minisyncoccia bacterium]